MKRFRFSLIGLMFFVWGAAVLLALARGSESEAMAIVTVFWTFWALVSWRFVEIVALRRIPPGKTKLNGRDRGLMVLAFALSTVAALGATTWLLRR